jgi:hypothetical protein
VVALDEWQSGSLCLVGNLVDISAHIANRAKEVSQIVSEFSTKLKDAWGDFTQRVHDHATHRNRRSFGPPDMKYISTEFVQGITIKEVDEDSAGG